MIEDMEFPSIREIMTTEVVSVRPETSIGEVNEIFGRHKYNGLPVVDDTNHLLGIITQYNLISGQGALHFPTLQKVLASLPVLKKDRDDFSADIGAVANMKVKDLMDSTPLVLKDNASFEQAVTLFTEHHRVNPIPVIDQENVVVGVVSRFDILKTLGASAKS